MKIGIVCSHGGHLTELLYMMDAFKGHDIFFVTYDNIRTRKLDYKTYLYPNLGEGNLSIVPFRLLKYLPSFINILRKEKPDLIVSNGAEIAIPFFYLSKLFRIKTIFIECYTRIDAPTITGKVVYPFSDLFLVLWPEMLDKYGKKAQYWGGIFDLDKIKTKEKEQGNYLLLITGMHSDFERLVKKMDEIAGEISDKVIIQLGNTKYIPKNAEYFKFKDYEEIKILIQNAKLVICQGAMTVMDSLMLGIPIIAVPRLKEYGEHLDDHQLIFTQKLAEKDLIQIVDDIDSLSELLLENDSMSSAIQINNDLIKKISDYLTSVLKVG